jgi:hypothetical protein
MILAMVFLFSGCEKKDPPMVENGFYFDYKKYEASKYGGCSAGGIVNYIWDVNLVNIPTEGSATANAGYFVGNCTTCCGVQVTNNPLTDRYFSVSGTVWREGPLVLFDVEVRHENDLDGGRNIRLKGSYICSE